MPDSPAIRTGWHRLALTCPQCHVGAEVSVYLDTRLTSDHSGATLRAALSGKPVEHRCRQLRLTTSAGQLFPDDAAADPDGVPGQLTLDGTDQAAAAAPGNRWH